ncbi:MAG: dNTP triphosphohydrolase [Treponema sp.]|nr:dNTP triphosphohydrolase [Treponema sp.]MEE3314567.1 dNTP triphosphohydrolase [Treponema sp.]
MENSFVSVRMDENHPDWEKCIKRENSLYERGNGIRSEFERDYTRILHSESYRRLKYKTQVFFAPQNDHICTRIEHVGHVASVSRTIARHLGLNQELTEAIALGHDIGHAPFGHTGESILNSLMSQKEGQNAPKKFWHERNSLFFADFIDTLADPDGNEKNLDLTYAVRDGFICHCGEIDEQGVMPRNEAMDLYNIKRPGIFSPYTWEGCVVKISDKIAFLGRDIEDAHTYHLLDETTSRQLREIVSSTLGFSGKDEQTPDAAKRSGKAVNTTTLINDLIVDLCSNSSPEKGFCFSERYFNFLKELKSFCAANIYRNWRLMEFSEYAKNVLGCIYRTLMKTSVYARNRTMHSCLQYAPELSETFTDWLIKYTAYNRDEKERRRYRTKEIFDIESDSGFEKCVIEYMSGMTDRFAIKTFGEIISL